MQTAEIDLEETAKECFINKSLIIEKVKKNLIKIYYRGESPRNTTKPIILPFSKEFIDFVIKEKFNGGDKIANC
jgi:hypothetical protein